MTDAILVEQRNLALCVSLGVALHPEDGRTVDALASGADAALFQAKQAGRNVVQFARHDAALRARQRIELADELREALKTGAIQPHFQPIVDLGSGSVVCAESLARWRHPVRGFVPPDQFISIAEDSGQIDALTEQLLRSACATAAGWEPLRGHAAPKLAFNLSARQVRQGVVEMVSAVLTETGLPASRLEIEITESAIIERPETAERLLLQLKELGVSVALDDFGTGYSSLSYLMRFPIDKIKVDRSFVSQVNGQRQAGKIVAATISLAASLDITLVAEGVETLGQMVTLYELGCRQQQGWMFSKALPSEEFARWSGKAPLKLDAVIRAQAEAANDVPHAA
jgi:predicted signal transduction protein with EAL and GGDEF domain